MGAMITIRTAFVFATAIWVQQAPCQEIRTYLGMSDASAAAAIGREHFVVADDECNTLLIYQRGQPKAIGSLELSTFLGTKDERESDLEGAATIGTRIYWISSHGLNTKGEVREERRRFFATDMQPGQPPTLKPFGEPYRNLLQDLLADDKLKAYNLADAAKWPPEMSEDGKMGLNIEGLAATPDGKLLIGFRNPIRGGLALIVPVENPGDLLKGEKARFGSPIGLDLRARGIRSIERVGSDYLIVAGPPGKEGSFDLYRWSGKAAEAASLVTGIDVSKLAPEALFAIPGTDTVQILSDDGGGPRVKCKGQEKEKSKQSFRSIIVKP